MYALPALTRHRRRGRPRPVRPRADRPARPGARSALARVRAVAGRRARPRIPRGRPAATPPCALTAPRLARVARVTLKTVAEHVGVSPMTVSNAFSRPDQLSAALREKILATAAELGYAGPGPGRAHPRPRRHRHGRHPVPRHAALRVLRRVRGRVPRGDRRGARPRRAGAHPAAERGHAGGRCPSGTSRWTGRSSTRAAPTESSFGWLRKRRLPLVLVDEPDDGDSAPTAASTSTTGPGRAPRPPTSSRWGTGGSRCSPWVRRRRTPATGSSRSSGCGAGATCWSPPGSSRSCGTSTKRRGRAGRRRPRAADRPDGPPACSASPTRSPPTCCAPPPTSVCACRRSSRWWASTTRRSPAAPLARRSPPSRRTWSAKGTLGRRGADQGGAPAAGGRARPGAPPPAAHRAGRPRHHRRRRDGASRVGRGAADPRHRIRCRTGPGS